MTNALPALSYHDWAETCDTLHGHTQLLGKLAVALAPPEPQLQHAALRLTARGIETAPLPAPDGSGSLVVALDLRTHQARVEHSARSEDELVALSGSRSVGEVTRDVMEIVQRLCGPVTVNMAPQEVPWKTPLDRDEEHATYDPSAVERYFTAATRAALMLNAFRAPFLGRSTPVDAWWGSFDLSANLYSGNPAEPPAQDYITRNAMNAQTMALGWWPGDRSRSGAAFYAYAYPPPDGFSGAAVEPAAAHWDEGLGEFILDWDDVRGADDPVGSVVRFGRSVYRAICDSDDWDPSLLVSASPQP